MGKNLENMICWEKINSSHVVKMSRRICYKWWEVDIHFYDEYGECRSTSTPFRNKLCGMLHEKSDSSMKCLKCDRKLFADGLNEKKFYTDKCCAGFDLIAVPLLTKDKSIMGFIAGFGLQFSDEGDPVLEKYIDDLVRVGIDRKEIEESYSRARRNNYNVRERLHDFLELVADDVMSFHEIMDEKEEIIKKQSVLLERAYNAKYKGIIGSSAKMMKIFDTLDLIENSGTTVLIEGESGTGKELLAAAIHYNSPRRDKMFVIQNCSTFNDKLLTSELFGHERGAFTGAVSSKKGLFEIADGGTLFLDEVGEMEFDVQAKLLRVLEDGSFYKVGGCEPKRVDVRVLVATNKDLNEMVEKKLFRNDLFYRINTIQITIPPLKERREDIVLLADYFLSSFAVIQGGEKKELERKVIDKFNSYKWPGNIRELKNVIERAILLSGKKKVIEVEHLPNWIAECDAADTPSPTIQEGSTLQDTLRGFEKVMIEEELTKAKWNKTVVAKKLGVSRATLNNKIEQLKIKQAG